MKYLLTTHDLTFPCKYMKNLESEEDLSKP